MPATTMRTPAKGKGLLRATVRTSTRSDRSPLVAAHAPRTGGPTMCERCGAVYEAKRWRAGTTEEIAMPIGLAWTVCPACRQIEAGEYFGTVSIRGAAAREREEEILRRVQRVAERARHTQVERRIVSVDRRGDALEVRTTSQKLAHRMVRALLQAFGGRGSYAWSSRDGELRAEWRWDDAPSHAPAPRRPYLTGQPKPESTRRPAAARRANAARAALAVGKRTPDVEIQCRHVPLHPRWRDLVDLWVGRWSERYPELSRVHVTLLHGAHHRHGAEEVGVIAGIPGGTLRIAKRGEVMTDSLHAAFGALDRQLRDIHRRRWKTAERPGTPRRARRKPMAAKARSGAGSRETRQT